MDCDISRLKSHCCFPIWILIKFMTNRMNILLKSLCLKALSFLYINGILYWHGKTFQNKIVCLISFPWILVWFVFFQIYVIKSGRIASNRIKAFVCILSNTRPLPLPPKIDLDIQDYGMFLEMLVVIMKKNVTVWILKLLVSILTIVFYISGYQVLICVKNFATVSISSLQLAVKDQNTGAHTKHPRINICGLLCIGQDFSTRC